MAKKHKSGTYVEGAIKPPVAKLPPPDKKNSPKAKKKRLESNPNTRNG